MGVHMYLVNVEHPECVSRVVERDAMSARRSTITFRCPSWVGSHITTLEWWGRADLVMGAAAVEIRDGGPFAVVALRTLRLALLSDAARDAIIRHAIVLPILLDTIREHDGDLLIMAIQIVVSLGHLGGRPFISALHAAGATEHVFERLEREPSSHEWVLCFEDILKWWIAALDVGCTRRFLLSERAQSLIDELQRSLPLSAAEQELIDRLLRLSAMWKRVGV